MKIKNFKEFLNEGNPWAYTRQMSDKNLHIAAKVEEIRNDIRDKIIKSGKKKISEIRELTKNLISEKEKEVGRKISYKFDVVGSRFKLGKDSYQIRIWFTGQNNLSSLIILGYYIKDLKIDESLNEAKTCSTMCDMIDNAKTLEEFLDSLVIKEKGRFGTYHYS